MSRCEECRGSEAEQDLLTAAGVAGPGLLAAAPLARDVLQPHARSLPAAGVQQCSLLSLFLRRDARERPLCCDAQQALRS
jgi:hypothetical protein